MSGFGSPVAQGSNPVGTGLSTLSDLMNVKRSQQALQTGVYQQQTAAAQAQQEGLKAQQQQGVQNFFQTWDPSEHVGQDGTTDLDSALQSDAFKGSGNAKPAVMQALLDIKNKQLSNKQALTTLNGDLIKQFGTGIGALAQDDDVKADTTDPVTGVNAGRAKVNEFLGNFSKLSPDAARVAQIYGPITQHAPPGKLAQGVGALQLQALDAGQERGQIYGTPTNIDTGGTVQPGTQAPASAGGGFTPSGPGIPKAPQQTANAAGAIINRNPQTGALSPAPVPGGAAPGGPPGGVNPTTAQAQNAQGMGGDDRIRYAQISQEGTNAQTGAQLSDQVASLAGQVRTGQLSKEWTDRLTALQQHDPTLTARQMLSKYAAQLKTMATSGATTDASRSQIDEGMPSPETMGPDAVKEAAQYVGGIFRMRGARQAYADQYAKNSGSSIGLREADDSFMRAADPTVFTYNALPPGPERQQFLSSRFGGDPNKIRDFVGRSNQVKHYAGSIQ